MSEDKYQLGEGCWFCRNDKEGEECVFDCEFDTPVHISCIREALEEDPDHPEAIFMKYLLE